MRFTTSLLSAVSATIMLAGAASAATLDDVKARGELVCGVSTGLPGFSNPNDKNEWAGIVVDVCRAVAAAVLGDASKARTKLGWEPEVDFPALVKMMVAHDLQREATKAGFELPG